MKQYKEQLQDISAIRNLMEESTRFVSLSGLSGVSAGVIALIGAAGTYAYLSAKGIYTLGTTTYLASREQVLELIGIALLILICAIAVSAFFTVRRVRRQEKKIWTKSTYRLILNLLIPLFAGAVFCIQLAWYGQPVHVAPATLIFYGLALLNAGKYTLREVRYLGICQIVLGLIAGMVPGYSIIFWSLGFGVLHIAYGTVMYLRYEK